MFTKRAIASITVAVLISTAAYGVSSHRRETTKLLAQSDQNLHRQRDELVARIQRGQEQLNRATGLTTAKPADIEQQLTSLEGLRAATELELLSKQVRAAELQKQIKKYQDEQAARAKSDPVSLQLQKVIAPVEDEAQRKRTNPQTYAPAEIAVAEASAASEQVRLLERQEQFGPDAPLMNSLRHDQIDLAGDIAELQARYNLLTERSKVLRSVERYLDHAERWQCQLKKIDARIRGNEGNAQNALGQI